jgi:hypothetical protein
MKQSIKFILKNKKLVYDKESLPFIKKWIDAHTDGDDLTLSVMTKHDARRLQAHRYYYSVILPLCAEHLPDGEKYIIFDGNCYKYNTLHRYLTLQFAINYNLPNIIEYVPTVHNGENIMFPVVSESFEKMNEKTFQDYIKYINNELFKYTNKTIEELSLVI